MQRISLIFWLFLSVGCGRQVNVHPDGAADADGDADGDNDVEQDVGPDADADPDQDMAFDSDRADGGDADGLFDADADQELVDGMVSLCLVSVTPNEPLVAAEQYELTYRLMSHLYSDLGAEDLWIEASVGDWGITNETPHINVANQTETNVVLTLTVPADASTETLTVRAYPDRRATRTFTLPPVDLTVGERIIPEQGLAACLACVQPGLTAEGVLSVPRAVMDVAIPLPFHILNLSNQDEIFLMRIAPVGEAREWVFNDGASTSTLGPNESQTHNEMMRIDDGEAASSPQTFTFQLERVVDGGQNETLPYTNWTVTFSLI